MGQRIVVIKLPSALFPDNDLDSRFLDLTPESIAEKAPKAAEPLKGGRIVSHSITTFGMPMEIHLSLIVEDVTTTE